MGASGTDMSVGRNLMTIDLDLFEAEINAQEFALDETEWASLLVSMRRAEVTHDA